MHKSSHGNIEKEEGTLHSTQGEGGEGETTGTVYRIEDLPSTSNSNRVPNKHYCFNTFSIRQTKKYQP